MIKQNFDDAINIVYEVSDQLWDIYLQYKMGDWCSKNEVKNITKNYARQLNTALKILEKERKLNNENRNNK
mgnify:CR=1 FL=1